MSTTAAREYKPRLVFWEVTKGCNLRCIHCRATATELASPSDLPTSKALDIIRQIAGYANPILVLSGGEPLYRTDIFQLARYGTDLGDLCAELTHGATSGVEDNVEGWGRVDSVLEDLAGDHAGSKNVPQAASRRLGHHVRPSTRESQDELVVLGSGNLGLVYVPGHERMLLEDIERTWPALVAGLVRHPGIGFVAALAADGPVAIGPTGRHHLATGCVEGDDPLKIFGAHAAAMVRAATDMPEAPDLYVNSSVDPVNLEVAAFEPLVGAHGGLGGWQDRAFVLAPGELFAPDVPIVGGDQLHRHLVGMLDKLGHRADLPGATAEVR